MASLEELRAARLHKLRLLKNAGMDAYPVSVPRDFSLKEAKARFAEFEDGEGGARAGMTASLAGRIMAIRGQGSILFLVLDDGTATFQAVVKKDVLDEKAFALLSQAADIGDIVSVSGIFFTTQRGEQSILVDRWAMASKSLSPLPEKWHGLTDLDEKFRKRYLDFIMDPEMRELFYKKAKFWEATRRILKNEGFLEVETPTLETTTGGAEATPFKTHHDDYDLDVFLRISVGELWQKRLLAAGFPRTYEIGRLYRNEGTSPEHAQEFTNLEFYASYMSFDEGIAFTEKMLKEIISEAFGTLEFELRGGKNDPGTGAGDGAGTGSGAGKDATGAGAGTDAKVDLSGEWRRIDYVDTVEKMTGINVLKAGEKDMEQKLKDLKVDYDGTNRERLTDSLWKFCRRQIIGPAWLVGHPKLVSPLSKADPRNPEKTLRVQLILAGAEMVNGFAELNDPLDQRVRFDAQKKLIEKGDREAMMPDWEFVEMLEHAMPPAFGMGFGGDRLFATLAGKSLRETQMFPLMRPK